LGNYRHRDELQAVQYRIQGGSLHLGCKQCERKHHERGGQSKARPSGESARPSGAAETDQKPDLAACRPRQHLAERYEPGILIGRHPLALPHIGALEIPEMRDRAAEGAEAEPERDAEHLACTAPRGGGNDAGPFAHLGASHIDFRAGFDAGLDGRPSSAFVQSLVKQLSCSRRAP
jgi:hypothetical protein